MELCFAAAILLGTAYIFWYKRPSPDLRTTTKKKVVKILLTPYRVSHKGSQTEEQFSPMSTISSLSSLDLQFVMDETYLEKMNETERRCDESPTTGTIEFAETQGTTTEEKTEP